MHFSATSAVVPARDWILIAEILSLEELLSDLYCRDALLHHRISA
jgi:hypothetical protein